MSGHRRRILSAVLWAGLVVALAVGVTLGVMGHRLAASVVLVGSGVAFVVYSWLTEPPATGRENPHRSWRIAGLHLRASASVALAGIVLLVAGPASMGTGLLIGGLAMASSGAFIRYTVRMDHPGMPDDPAPRVQRHN